CEGGTCAFDHEVAHNKCDGSSQILCLASCTLLSCSHTRLPQRDSLRWQVSLGGLHRAGISLSHARGEFARAWHFAAMGSLHLRRYAIHGGYSGGVLVSV